MSKTLIFGGAFDPPHTQHIAIVQAALKQLDIHRLVLVPTYNPAHKGAGRVSFEDRSELARLSFGGALGDEAEIIVDGIEGERKRENYSCFILPLLKKKYGDIVYLIGGDSLGYFDNWYRPQDIVKVCPIAVAARQGYDDIDGMISDIKSRYDGDFIKIDCVGKEVSSSNIKARLLLGEEPDEIAPAALGFIRRKGMFVDYIPMVQKVRELEGEELFSHSRAVVLRAIDFNSRHRLMQDFDRTFIAALLHDNAKRRPSLDGLNVPADAVGTSVLHQFLGAEKAERDFGVTDEQILSAIRYHTTARANMTLFEKLIYVADSLSDDRTYPPIPDLRAIALKDFEAGFKATLKYTYDKLTSQGKPIYPLTVEAYNFYLRPEN